VTDQPQVFVEGWVNYPAAEATVTAAWPAALPGAKETWAVTGGTMPPWPPASATQNPPDLYRVFDPADPREIIQVQHQGPGTWQVLRGDQGSLPVAHKAGAKLRPFITANGLASRVQGVPSGLGITLDNRRITDAVTLTRSGGGGWGPAPVQYIVGPMPIPKGELNSGATYEAVAWGTYSIGTALDPGNLPLATRPSLAFGIGFAGGILDKLTWRFGGAYPVGCRFRCHAYAVSYPAGAGPQGTPTPQVSANMTLTMATSATETVQVPQVAMIGTTAAFTGVPDLLTDTDLVLRIGLEQTGMTGRPTGDEILVLGGKIWRIA
jgi:hypothetical protein